MALLLTIAILLLTGATVILFASGYWWFPTPISAHATVIDRQFNVTLAIVAIAFVAVHLALAYVIWRYRGSRSGAVRYSEGNHRLELVGAAVTAVVFVSLAVFGQRVWAELYLNDAPADAIAIEVTGQQFVWNFRYPGPGGTFGLTRPALYNDEDNSPTARPGPVGIEPTDPEGKDDIVTVGIVVVPVGRPVKLLLRAKDVTHSFFVPELRLKQDAVPGMKINVHFLPTREGRFEIACAELCGIGHHRMRAFLEVRSQIEFEKWLAEKASQ